MDNIKFDSEDAYVTAAHVNKPRGLVAFVLKQGLAKDERQASLVLLGIAGVAVVLAVAIPLFMNPGSGKLTAEQERQLQEVERYMSQHRTP